MKTKTVSLLLVTVLLFASLSGCAVLDKLRPAITSAALTLLIELEALLREYEAPATVQSSGSAGIRTKATSQDALYRDISELLRLCHGQIPASRLRKYQARLDAASARAR